MREVLEEMRRLLEKATPGPLEVVAAGDSFVISAPDAGFGVVFIATMTGYKRMVQPNAELFVALRNHAPALLSSAESAERMREALFSRDLYELLTNIQNGISTPADRQMANSCIRRIDNARSALSSPPSSLQDAGVREGNEWRKDFETLSRAVVGETGLSAIEEAPKARRDAERWRALIGCARVRVIGYARGGPNGGEGAIRHIGFEFTTDHPDFPDREAEKSEGVKTLIEFVDAARKQEQKL